MSTQLFPLAVWQSGTNENSIPANDNALRVEVLMGPAVGVANSAPSSPSDNAQYVVGTPWGGFSENNVVIYKGGTWLEWEAFNGWNKTIAGVLNYFNGSDWVVGAGGSGSGDVLGPPSATDNRIAVFDGATGKLLKDGGYTIAQLRELALTTPVNVQTGTAYTLVLADSFRMVCMDNTATNTLTVPPNSAVAFPVGTRIDIGQDGTGQTTIAAGAGVTIRTPETLKMRKQWSKATLIKRAINTWDIEGNLEAAP